MRDWLKKRPLLLWGFGWSVYFEVMWLLWGGKLPHSASLGFYLMAPLWSLLFCIRPAVARILKFVYVLGVVAGVGLPLKAGLDHMLGIALGGACLSALFMSAFTTHLQKLAPRPTNTTD